MDNFLNHNLECLEESLKETGNHFVHIHLDEDLKPKIKVKIAAEK